MIIVYDVPLDAVGIIKVPVSNAGADAECLPALGVVPAPGLPFLGSLGGKRIRAAWKP